MNIFRVFKISKLAGIASFFINLFLILLIVSTVISAMRLNVTFNGLSMYFESGQVHVIANFTVENNGYYEFNDVMARFIILDPQNNELFDINHTIGAIPVGVKHITINFSLPMIFNLVKDETYILLVSVSGSYAYHLMRLGFRFPNDIPWDAPLDNLTINVKTASISATTANLTATCTFNSPDNYDYFLTITMNVYEGDVFINKVTHSNLLVQHSTKFTDTLWIEVDRGKTYNLIFAFNATSFFNYTYTILEVEVP